MIVDGKKIAEEIKDQLRPQLSKLGLRLVVVLVGDNPVSERYVRQKEKIGKDLGVEVVVHELMADVTESDLISEIKRLGDDDQVNGIIVQLPLPAHIDRDKILNLIPAEKDIDALSADAKIFSPVVGVVREILDQSKISVMGKKAVVIGNGKLVGRPVAIWLAQEGAEVEVVDLETKNSVEIIGEADIIISGVGKPGLITPDIVKSGAVLLDAGTSEQNGQLLGDALPACADKCFIFTPVPGGIGPLTVVMLFKNLLELNS